MIRQERPLHVDARHSNWRVSLSVAAMAVAALLSGPQLLRAQDAPATTQAAEQATQADQTDQKKVSLDIYGFAMMDSGFDFKSINPNWFDVERPTQLPAYPNEYGKNGNWYAGVRQSRMGVKGDIDTPLGHIKTIFEFELFGTGVDAGQTTFRLRHAWGELGKFGAGQTWSPFMDPDVFPNSTEYWGPNGMVFFRNVQFRYTPWSRGDSNLVFAIERPGASADQGVYAGRIELQGVKPRFPAPDISGHYRLAGSKGHVQIAGIFRKMYWDDLNATSTLNLSGNATGWGVNLSGNVKVSRHVLRLQAVYGQGIENYMNDAPVDVGVANNFSNPYRPLLGKALPILGLVGFFDLNWSKKWTSTIGYSRVDIQTTSGEGAETFKSGQYALTNILYYPVKGAMLGPEFQWGYRDNKSGWHVPDYRIQFSAKYNFGFKVGA